MRPKKIGNTIRRNLRPDTNQRVPLCGHGRKFRCVFGFEIGAGFFGGDQSVSGFSREKCASGRCRSVNCYVTEGREDMTNVIELQDQDSPMASRIRGNRRLALMDEFCDVKTRFPSLHDCGWTNGESWAYTLARLVEVVRDDDAV